ncbi:hypothetical protein QWY86_07500 [Pedobacter aquatilis]|nr:hypothetical protein [Pedobacter aquatilis]
MINLIERKYFLFFSLSEAKGNKKIAEIAGLLTAKSFGDHFLK